MKLSLRHLRFAAVTATFMAIGVASTHVFGQEEKIEVTKEKIKATAKEHKEHKSYAFCQQNNWSGNERVSFSELREFNVVSTGSLSVDGGTNGGISVKGEDRSDVLIKACVQAWGQDEASARAAASSVRIGTAGTIAAEGPPATGERNGNSWSVSYQVLVPRNTGVNLKAHNGGIAVSNIDGSVEFSTTNGGVSVSNLSGSVKGNTKNGGVNVVLAGNSWKGSGLDVTTTNGGVNLVMPANYAANVEMGTMNGGFSSEIPGLQPEKNEQQRWNRATRISTSLNGGGAPIRVITTNGGVRVSTPNE